MATGDQSDMFQRVKATLPRWFGDTTPILDLVVQGIANMLSYVYAQYAYAKQQTRFLTMSDGWLDLFAGDFLGDKLQRKSNETDAQYRARIQINMFRERATRAGLVKVLKDVTGRAPLVFEPQRPADTGAYGGPTLGYGMAGGYGSLLLPAQCFVTVFRPTTSGIPNVAGYGISTGGYGQASQADYASISQVQGFVADADLYAAVDSVKPAGTTAWVKLSN
jgi:hypothetical protein